MNNTYLPPSKIIIIINTTFSTNFKIVICTALTTRRPRVHYKYKQLKEDK